MSSVSPVQNTFLNATREPVSCTGSCAISGVIRICLLLSMLFGQLVYGADFNITQIADRSVLNREPVISDTGLVAWYGLEKADSAAAASDIYIYENGKRQILTKGFSKYPAAAVKPRISGNMVVWESALNPSLIGRDKYTWSMREPPLNPNDPPVLNANYQAFCEDDGAAGNIGKQWFEGITNTADDANATNSPVSRGGTGNSEIFLWKGGAEITRITSDNRNDLAPDCSDGMLVWQKAKGWPFGWEIMVWKDDFRQQLTTNYYYDMAPVVQGSRAVWYGWDGNDFEIFMYEYDKQLITQITSNYYDDVSPQVAEDIIVWQAYQTVESDIWIYRDGDILKVSKNVDDDISPRAWKGQAVWQGFDGHNFQIYLYDGEKTIKLTNEKFDNVSPDIQDGLICWIGYHDNWDAEVFVSDQRQTTMLTENDYEDRHPRTAGGKVVWQADHDDLSDVYLAVPK